MRHPPLLPNCWRCLGALLLCLLTAINHQLTVPVQGIDVDTEELERSERTAPLARVLPPLMRPRMNADGTLIEAKPMLGWLNAQRAASQLEGAEAKRQKDDVKNRKHKRIHSVSRSVNVNSYRSQQQQLLDSVLARRAERLSRKSASQEPAESGEQSQRQRALLTNEGFERASVIVVPIDRPRVLTAEKFATLKGVKLVGNGKTPAKGGNKRIEGEAHSANDLDLFGRLNNSYYYEPIRESPGSAADDKSAPIPLGVPKTQSNDVPSPPNQLPSIAPDGSPPVVLAARNKSILKGAKKAQNNVGEKGSGGPLHDLMREIGLADDAKKPRVAFLIDDDREGHMFAVPSSPGGAVAKPNLRTKFPKNRASAKPIQLTKADESDMDLLSPPGELKPRQKFPPPLDASIGDGQRKQPRQQQTAAKPTPHSSVPTDSLPLPSTQQHPSLPPQPVPIPPIVPQNAPVAAAAPTHQSSSASSPQSASALSANAKLELCCRRQQLPSTCQQFCNYDTFTQEKLLIALLGTQCPAKQLTKAFDCAHSKVDHSACCRREGIEKINNGQCMVFCRTHIPTPPNVVGYVSCLGAFGTIKNCYKEHQQRHKNLFGD